MDDVASIRAFGLDVVTQACERLIAGGVPASTLHAQPVGLALEICKRLASRFDLGSW